MPALLRPGLVCLLLAFAVPALCASRAEPVPAPTPATVIHAGSLLATPGDAPLGPHTVVVRDGRIAALEPGFRSPAEYGADSRLIDLSDRFMLPGLVDLHMHLAIIMDAGHVTSSSESRLALAAAGYAADLLRAGVTTVRDTGDNTWVTLALRDAIAGGALPGPRLFAAGRIVSRTGGHGARSASVVEVPYDPAGCDGPESCRRAVRGNIERGVDWIKLTSSGSGRETTGRADAAPILFEDELASAAAAAQQAQRPLAVHAHSTAAINQALKAGARTIEHGTYFDAESAALFRQTGAFLVPTAFVADFVRARLDMFGAGQDGRGASDLRDWTEAAVAVPGRAWRAGIRLGLGTDGGPSFDTDATAREIERYVDSGVPISEAIRAATSNGAEILGMGEELGRILPGYIADIIAIQGSPLEDASRLREVAFVMKEGVVHKFCGSSDTGPDCRLRERTQARR